MSDTFLGDHRIYKVKVKEQVFLTVKSLQELNGKVCVRIPARKVHLFSDQGAGI
jgi:hypothetical protein